jgi:catechol 2,3-dioxygenase-like lactoylglutathione lyase family enzyme
MKLAAARIFVRNLEEAKTFYQTSLGLRVKAQNLDYGFVVFDAQSCELLVERVPLDAPQDEQILVGRFTGLSFAVQNIGSLYQTLTSKGVPFSGAPEKQAWGGTLATLRDPSGNELQLVEYPSAALAF